MPRLSAHCPSLFCRALLLVLLCVAAPALAEEDCETFDELGDGVALCLPDTVAPGSSLSLRIAAEGRPDVTATIPTDPRLDTHCPGASHPWLFLDDAPLELGGEHPVWAIEIRVNRGGSDADCSCAASQTHIVLYDAHAHSVLAVLPWSVEAERCNATVLDARSVLVHAPDDEPGLDPIFAVGPDTITQCTADKDGRYAPASTAPTCGEGSTWTHISDDSALSEVFGCVRDGALAGRGFERLYDERMITLDDAEFWTTAAPLDTLASAGETLDVLAVRVVSVLGDMDKTIVRRQLSRIGEPLHACRALTVERGTIRAKLIVMTKGTVMNAVIIARDFESASYETCVLDALKQLQLPSGRIDGAIILEVDVERLSMSP